MYPLCLHEIGVTYFGFKIGQGFGCSGYQGVSSTVWSPSRLPHIFYVAVPFQIHPVFICVMLHQDTCCKVLGEDYLIMVCQFTHMPPMQQVIMVFCCYLEDKDLLGNCFSNGRKICFKKKCLIQ